MTEMIQMKRNECANLVRMSNRKRNIVRASSSEGARHRFEKEIVCHNLEKQGKEYITEAIFEGDENLRADVLVLDDFKVIEIAHSESEQSLDNKRKKYKNIGLTMEVIRI